MLRYCEFCSKIAHVCMFEATWEIHSMAKGRGDFTDVLINKQVLSADQLGEARHMAQQTGAKIQDAIVKLGYCTLEDVMAAIAEHSGMQSVSLVDVSIPP